MSCEICAHRFNSFTHVPLVFDCGHSCCAVCLPQFHPTPGTCPWDRKIIQKVSTNYKVLEMVESGLSDLYSTCEEHGKPNSFICSHCTATKCLDCIKSTCQCMNNDSSGYLIIEEVIQRSKREYVAVMNLYQQLRRDVQLPRESPWSTNMELLGKRHAAEVEGELRGLQHNIEGILHVGLNSTKMKRLKTECNEEVHRIVQDRDTLNGFNLLEPSFWKVFGLWSDHTLSSSRQKRLDVKCSSYKQRLHGLDTFINTKLIELAVHPYPENFLANVDYNIPMLGFSPDIQQLSGIFQLSFEDQAHTSLKVTRRLSLESDHLLDTTTFKHVSKVTFTMMAHITGIKKEEIMGIVVLHSVLVHIDHLILNFQSSSFTTEILLLLERVQPLKGFPNLSKLAISLDHTNLISLEPASVGKAFLRSVPILLQELKLNMRGCFQTEKEQLIVLQELEKACPSLTRLHLTMGFANDTCSKELVRLCCRLTQLKKLKLNFQESAIRDLELKLLFHYLGASLTNRLHSLSIDLQGLDLQGEFIEDIHGAFVDHKLQKISLNLNGLPLTFVQFDKLMMTICALFPTIRVKLEAQGCEFARKMNKGQKEKYENIYKGILCGGGKGLMW